MGAWSEREMSSKLRMSEMSSWLGMERKEEDLEEEQRERGGGEVDVVSETEDMLWML